MAEIQLVPAEFGGFVVETVLYGIVHFTRWVKLCLIPTSYLGMYFIMHIMCIYVLVLRDYWDGQKRHRRPASKILVISSNALFVSITAVRFPSLSLRDIHVDVLIYSIG